MVALSAEDRARPRMTDQAQRTQTDQAQRTQTDQAQRTQTGEAQRTQTGQVDRTPQRQVVDLRDQQASRTRAAGTEQQVRQRQQPLAAEGPSLRRGARGPQVEMLQRSLNERGANPPLEVDGRFGPLTQGAVRAYQRANPPLATDGVVGPRTRTSLAKPANETNHIGTQNPQRPGTPERPGGPQGPQGPEQPQRPGETTGTDAATLNRMNPRDMTPQQAAQALLNSPNVSFWGGLSTGSDRRQFERIARGENPAVPAHGANATTSINPNMMRALVQMSREGRIQVNALTGGSHSTNSQHYRGNAVDLQPNIRGNLSTARIRQIAAEYGGVKNNEAHIHLTFAR
jgi:peptidoglycan hydrolase-like protein with peptidoglycan-binding domain